MARPRRHGGLGGGTPIYPTGGTPFQPHYHPHPTGGSLVASPPQYTFDPAIEAERRAQQRGLEDTEARVHTERHFAQSKLLEALRKTHREAARGRQDIGIKQQRGEQKLGYDREDVNKSATRKEEDFNTQLASVARSFKELGNRQTEGANAAGVLDKGTLAASQAARTRNQGLAEEPIHVGQKRVAEDLNTALGRIGTSEGELGEDTQRATSRLNQDARFEKRAAHREFGQKAFNLFRELQQAKREGQIENISKLQQEIYESRANHPGAFKQWAAEHPEVIAAAAAGGGLPHAGGGHQGGGSKPGGGGNRGGGGGNRGGNKKKGR